VDRIRLLKGLGYELSDLDLWDGWLLLEESSAERIIRDNLVRWFAPGLSRIRLMAANGTGDVPRSFDALYKLVLFTHLEARYKGRVLVILDGDPSGIETIDKLKLQFKNWPSDAFTTFSKDAFEGYFPGRFNDEVTKALSVEDKGKRRKAKRALLLDVLTWIDENEALAKQEFEVSAAEVIEKLRAFEIALGPTSGLGSSRTAG